MPGVLEGHPRPRLASTNASPRSNSDRKNFPLEIRRIPVWQSVGDCLADANERTNEARIEEEKETVEERQRRLVTEAVNFLQSKSIKLKEAPSDFAAKARRVDNFEISKIESRQVNDSFIGKFKLKNAGNRAYMPVASKIYRLPHHQSKANDFGKFNKV